MKSRPNLTHWDWIPMGWVGSKKLSQFRPNGHSKFAHRFFHFLRASKTSKRRTATIKTTCRSFSIAIVKNVEIYHVNTWCDEKKYIYRRTLVVIFCTDVADVSFDFENTQIFRILQSFYADTTQFDHYRRYKLSESFLFARHDEDSKEKTTRKTRETIEKRQSTERKQQKKSIRVKEHKKCLKKRMQMNYLI